MFRDVSLRTAQNDPIWKEVVGLIHVHPLPIGASRGIAGKFGVDLKLLSLPSVIEGPGFHLVNGVCPADVRLASRPVSDAGGSQQVSSLSIKHSDAVLDVDKLEEEFKGRIWVGRRLGISKTAEPILMAVIFDVVFPLFLDRTPVCIAVVIYLNNLGLGWVCPEESRAREGLIDLARWATAGPTSSPISQVMPPEQLASAP